MAEPPPESCSELASMVRSGAAVLVWTGPGGVPCTVPLSPEICVMNHPLPGLRTMCMVKGSFWVKTTLLHVWFDGTLAQVWSALNVYFCCHVARMSASLQ